MSREAEAECGRKPPTILCAAEDVPRLLGRNSLLLATRVNDLASEWNGRLAFTPDVLRDFHRTALQGVFDFAGEFRTEFVDVGRYVPPKHQEIEGLVMAMCDYANHSTSGPLHTAAYLMWRVNWVHPFFDGNGRVARAASYLGLLVECGLSELPGSPTIPELIDQRYRSAYYDALEEADRSWARDLQVNVRAMESLLSDLVVIQAESGL